MNHPLDLLAHLVQGTQYSLYVTRVGQRKLLTEAILPSGDDYRTRYRIDSGQVIDVGWGKRTPGSEACYLVPESIAILTQEALLHAIRDEVAAFVPVIQDLAEGMSSQLTYWCLKSYQAREKDRGTFLVSIDTEGQYRGEGESRLSGYMVGGNADDPRIDKHTVAAWRFRRMNDDDALLKPLRTPNVSA